MLQKELVPFHPVRESDDTDTESDMVMDETSDLDSEDAALSAAIANADDDEENLKRRGMDGDESESDSEGYPEDEISSSFGEKEEIGNQAPAPNDNQPQEAPADSQGPQENNDNAEVAAAGGQEEIPAEEASERRRSIRVSIRDKLVLKELCTEKLADMLPGTCKLIFPDPNQLHSFNLEVTPDEGYYQGGKFAFSINVPEGYNHEPPKVKCNTRIWHPNIAEEGAVCLSILRAGGIDENAWSPVCQLKDVVLGINSLFLDLLNFDDPLNTEAAGMFKKNADEFERKVRSYIRMYSQSRQD